MYIKIEIVTRLNDGQSMLGARAQRNIFHRCFELHLLHLDDERDLHRAAPRDVTLENLTL